MLKLALIGLLTLLAPIQASDKKSDTDSRLETLLQEWEKADREVQELHFTFQSTIEDRVLKDKQITRGEAFVERPGLLRVDWRDEKEKVWKTWVWNNGFLYEYDLEKQEIHIFRISSDLSDESLDRGWLLNGISRQLHRSLQWFYIGFPINQMRQRYLFRLTKEDKYWAYIKIDPREDKEGEFKDLEVVLNQKTHLVRQIRCLDWCGRRVIWDYEHVEINPTPAITLESISKNLSKSWKKQYVPIVRSEAIEIAKDFLNGEKKLSPQFKATATPTETKNNEWQVLFVDPADDLKSILVMVSDDGTEARLVSERR